MTKTEIKKIITKHMEEYLKENKIMYDQCIITEEYNNGFNEAMKKMEEVIKFAFNIDEDK